jgi:hypothetical protein
MANVIFPNFGMVTNDIFNVIWKLTRAMKKAGWIYKASGDGTSLGKDTSGNPANDKWGGNADPALDSYPSFGSVSAWWCAQGPSTLKVPITSASVGTFMRGEDGYQASTGAHGEILGYIFDTNAASTQTSIISDSSLLPQSTINVNSTTGFLSSGTILVNTTNGAQTVTYTGLTATSFTGCIGGTGIMAVGGAVTQSQGYLVISPRVDGIGADPHGWNHTGAITGSISGATVTPSSTVLEYVCEIVFWKDTTSPPNLTNGHIYYQRVDGYNEKSSRYSVLATTATANGAQAPGSGGAAENNFPSVGSFTFIGTGGGPLASSNLWTNYTPSLSQTRAQIIAVNATYGPNVSADGSFTIAIGQPLVDAGSWHGFHFGRVDNQESGDVDPYAFYVPSGDTPYNQKFATALTVVGGGNDSTFTTGGTGSSQSASPMFRFWRRRGLSGEGFTTGLYSGMYIGQTGNFNQYLYAPNVALPGGGDRETLACTFSTTYVSDDIWAISSQAFVRCRKGSFRWMRTVGSGINASGTDTFGNKSWIGLSSKTNVESSVPFIVGPWDGYTTPVNS